jgi:hypothetical protein
MHLAASLQEAYFFASDESTLHQRNSRQPSSCVRDTYVPMKLSASARNVTVSLMAIVVPLAMMILASHGHEGSELAVYHPFRLISLAMTPAAMFYATSSISMLGIWGGFTLMVGNDFHARGSTASVATCPSWLPHWMVLTLLQKQVYLVVCHSAPVMLALSAMAPDIRWLRFCTAACVAVYSLAETSVTHSHRDYSGLYSAVSLAVLPDKYAEAVALGVCVHFIASSGWAKVLVGGLSGWLSPGTLRSVIQCYGKYSLGEAGPAIPAMNRLVASSDVLLTSLSAKTLLFECILVPASLFLPSHLRVYMIVASVALHFGIAAVQSGLVGLAFVPNIATYILGFGADLPVGSPPWLV